MAEQTGDVTATRSSPSHPSVPSPPSSPRDHVPLAVSSVGFGVLLGTVLMTGSLLLNRWLIRDLAASGIPDVNQPAANVLLAGALASILVPVLVAWTLLAPIGFAYRRFGLAMVSGFGAFLLSLVSVPVNEFLGLPGLAGLFVLALLGTLGLFRSVQRARARA